MMRDQRGLTLVELLGAMTLTLVLLTVAFSVYYAVHKTAADGLERYLDKSAVDLVMDTLTGELADATTVFVSAAGDEVRCTNGAAARAIVFDAARRTLTLYDFSAGASPADKLANVTDGSIRPADRPELYANPRELPAAVAGIRLYDGQGSPIAGASVGSGAVVRLSVTFGTKAGGAAETRTVETAVKLFHDAA